MNILQFKNKTLNIWKSSTSRLIQPFVKFNKLLKLLDKIDIREDKNGDVIITTNKNMLLYSTESLMVYNEKYQVIAVNYDKGTTDINPTLSKNINEYINPNDVSGTLIKIHEEADRINIELIEESEHGRNVIDCNHKEK